MNLGVGPILVIAAIVLGGVTQQIARSDARKAKEAGRSGLGLSSRVWLLSVVFVALLVIGSVLTLNSFER